MRPNSRNLTRIARCLNRSSFCLVPCSALLSCFPKPAKKPTDKTWTGEGELLSPAFSLCTSIESKLPLRMQDACITPGWIGGAQLEALSEGRPIGREPRVRRARRDLEIFPKTFRACISRACVSWACVSRACISWGYTSRAFIS